VVPNYNCGQYLPQALGSIARQTRPPDEVLIIDDGSVDDSVSVINGFLADRRTWRLIRHAERLGVVRRQNEALAEVRADWITFLGADDLMCPRHLERTGHLAEACPSAGLVCGCAEIFGPSRSPALRPPILPRMTVGYTSPNEFRDLLQAGDNYFVGPATLYRRSGVLEVGGFDEQLGSICDGFISRQLAVRYGFGFIPEVLGYWRMHDKNYSVSTATSPQKLEAALRSLRAKLAREPAGGFATDYYDTLSRRIRFGGVRLIALNRKKPFQTRAAEIAALLHAGDLERQMLSIFLAAGSLGLMIALAWLTLRLRPLSLLRLLGNVPVRRAILAAAKRLPEPIKIGATGTSPSPVLAKKSRIRSVGSSRMVWRAGTLRRLTYRSQVAPVGVTALSGTGGSNLTAHLRNAASAIATPSYRTLIRHRRPLKPVFGIISRWFDRAAEPGGVGERLLEFAYRQARTGRLSLARSALAVVRCGLMLATQFHLAASQRASAIKTARIINLLFRSQIRTRRGLLADLYFQVLLLSAFYERIVREIPRPKQSDDFIVNFAAGSAHLYMLHQQNAQNFLNRAVALSHDRSHEARRRLGCSYLLDQNEDAATRQFQRAVEIFPSSIMAHHNYGGRYDIAGYRPKDWEAAEAGKLMIYDNFIRLGEEFYLLGRLEDSMRTYQRAFRYQAKLRGSSMLPVVLVKRLAQQCGSFLADHTVRLLGYEWVTQIGHMGLLVWHMRMVRLGMLPQANYVLLAPRHKVANAAMLDRLDALYCVVRDPDLVDELFPYQRLFGDQFIAFPSHSDLAEPWAHAAARAQAMWTKKKLPPLVTLSNEDREFGRSELVRLGVPADVWYVGLHVREGGFHSDGSGTTLAHRSAAIEDYFPAIAEVTARGGWVIRLGDKSMKPLPEMANVVDYAHSTAKSPRMDIFLMGTSRFIIGTTSGLSTATQVFGTPMLLVNCISSDCQFWTAETDFIVKPVFDVRHRRYLTLGETYRQPLQSYLINATNLVRRGYEVHNNSAEDIRAAVAYKLDYIFGYAPRVSEDDPLLRQYRAVLAHNPYNFGSALPALPFLKSHPEHLSAGKTMATAAE
jgi:putative glycosyltransferase (TIGR04372 family)